MKRSTWVKSAYCPICCTKTYEERENRSAVETPQGIMRIEEAGCVKNAEIERNPRCIEGT